MYMYIQRDNYMSIYIYIHIYTTTLLQQCISIRRCVATHQQYIRILHQYTAHWYTSILYVVVYQYIVFVYVDVQQHALIIIICLLVVLWLSLLSSSYIYIYIYYITSTRVIIITINQTIISPGLPQKIPVFSAPAPGESYATIYEQMGS